MKIVNNNIKNALKQPTTQRKGKILVDGNYYEVYNVEYFADTYEDGNVIGNAIASQLDFDLAYMPKFNEFRYFDGVWTGNDYEYVDMGTFTVFDEKDEDEFNKHITSFDNLIKFNKPFEEIGTYPKTLYEELQNICQQAGIELKNETIPNGNFQVENNQFINGETLKTVLKAICQISGNYGIIKEDKLVLQLSNDGKETIIKSQHEPVTWKRKTYGINQVILQLGDVEGEYVIRQDEADIEKNGVHKLVITNNAFAYTQDKRNALIDELFNQVRGFGYIPYEMNCEWLNYLEIGDKITIDDTETLVLRIQGKSPKALESIVSSPAIIDSAVEYSNNANSIKNQISRAEIIVDKQNQEIKLIASKTEETKKTLKTEKSVESNGEEIYIEDSGGYDLEKLRIDGKSTQKTRSGKNLVKLPLQNNVDVIGLKRSLNISSIQLNGTTTAGGDILRYTLGTFKAGTYTYRHITNNNFSFPNVSGAAFAVYIRETNTNKEIVGLATTINSSSTQRTFTLEEDTELLLQFYINNQAVGTIFDDFNIKIQIEKGSTATEWEQGGISPSPDYPSEIESVGYKNLFDKDNANIINCLVNGQNGGIANFDGTKTLYIPIERNTTYTISKILSARFVVGTCSSIPANGVTCGEYSANNTGTSITITSGVNDKYLVVFYYLSSTDTLIEQQILDSIQIEEGSIAHSYIPYGKYGVEVKITNGTDTNTKVIALNEPLRSLSDEIKDIAYIKNNKLYVDRYVGSINLDGSGDEIYQQRNNGDGSTTIAFNLLQLQGLIKNYGADCIKTNKFAYEQNSSSGGEGIGIAQNTFDVYIQIKRSRLSSLNAEGFKTWLSNNNVKVDYELATPITEVIGFVSIPTFENINHINLYGKISTSFGITYLTNSYLNEQFATKSEIKQTVDEINIEVAKKVSNDEVVSAINLSPEKIKLKSNRLEIDSTYFKLSEDGKIESTSGEIGGFELQENSLKITHLPEESDFTQDDLLIVRNHVQNGTSLSEEQIIKYDFNGDGKVTAVDLLKLQNIVLVKNQNVNIEINSDDFENFINVESDNFGTSFNVSLSGTTINSLTTNDITIKDKNGNTSLNIFEDGTISADMTNSEGGVWTIQNFGYQVFTVNKNGQVECVSLTQTSQEKYKKNFEKLENALDIIKDTDIYKYNLKTQNNDDKKHIGFVIGDNYKYSEEITSGENDGVDIYSMVSVCFKAIKEQQEQIEILKKEIKKLKEMIK